VRTAVTGGTGFVGRHLVKRLLAEGHEVNVLTHEKQSVNQSENGLTYVNGAIENIESLKRTFKDVETVFHLVGIIAETKEKTFDKTVALGTKNVIEACHSCGVKKIMYLSALGTSSEAKTEYHRTKYQAEQAVAGSSLDYVIFRASIIYGPESQFVDILSRLIRLSPVTVVLGSGRYQLQPIYIDDLSYMMVKSLTHAEATGEIIDAAGPEKLEYIEILRILKKVLRKKRMNLFIPIIVIKAMVLLMEKLLKPAPLTRDQLTMMLEGSTGDIKKMKELFDISPIGFEEGLNKYMR